MNNVCKRFLTFVITILMVIIGGSKVLAFDSKIGPIKEGNWIGNRSTDLTFTEKWSGSTYVFCTSGIDAHDPFNRECILKASQWNESTQAGIGAIIDSFDQNLSNTGTNPTLNSTYTKFWYTEIAINSYLGNYVDKNWGTNTENDATVVALKKLAKAASDKASAEFNVSLSSNNLNFKKDGNYYVSDKITVKADYLDDFYVKVEGTDNVEVIEKDSNSFKVRFPVSNLGLGETIKVTARVTGKKSYKVAKNYDCGSDVQNVTIDYLEKVTKTSVANAEGSVTRGGTNVEISKVDITNQKEIAGAHLVIKDSNGKVVEEWDSLKTPHIIKNKLSAGKYTLSETIAPVGYKKSTKEVTFEVKEDGSVNKVKFENEPYKTGVKLSKVDITNGKEIAGATILITNTKTKSVVKSWVSTGKTEFIELEPGEYELSETIAPVGYKKSTKTVKFTVKKDGTVDTVKFENEPVKTGVKLSKVDVTSKKEIAGATLLITNTKTKSVVRSWVSTGKTEFIELEPGEYELSETIAPEGYKKSTKTVKFTVKKDGTVDTVKFENEPEKSGALISKKDATNGEELPGAHLVIKDSKGKVVEEWDSINEPKYFALEPGDYTLSETIAPEGYKLSTTTVKFTVKKGGKTTPVEMINEPYKTGAKISKQDIAEKGKKDAKELPGATLVIKDENGNEVDKWVSTNEIHYVDLKPGKYTLSETIAPVGYKVTTETIEFEVKNDGTIAKVTMYNEPNKTGVKISKQDITSKEELPGATLVVKDESGNEVARWLSGDKPVYIELEPGNYTLTEITAPNGYDLSYEVIRFTVNEDGTTNGDVVMYNSKTPKTADRNIIFMVVGLIGAGATGVFALRKLKHQM